MKSDCEALYIFACEITSKFFHKGRFYVRFNMPFRGRNSIPYAHYIWLMGNPAFIDIPQGYIIHHIDHNETNDDLTNLVLMQKYQHAAYHWKAKKVESPKMKFIHKGTLEENLYFPVKPPRVIFNKQRNCYAVSFSEQIDGMLKRKVIHIYKKVRLDTKEKAKRAALEIWERSRLLNVN